MTTLRRRPMRLFLGRLRLAALLTFWLPLLLILVDRGLPMLQLGAYLVALVAVTFAYHMFESLGDRSRTALVPVAFYLGTDGLSMDVRNVGKVDARTCDLQAWVVRAAAGSREEPPDGKPPGIPPEQRPHFAQRLVALPPGEELRGYSLTRAPGSPELRPGRYHLKWRTATIDGQDRRTSLEGWVMVTLAE